MPRFSRTSSLRRSRRSDAVRDSRVDRADIAVIAGALLVAGALIGATALGDARNPRNVSAAPTILLGLTPEPTASAATQRIDLIVQDGAGVDVLASALGTASGATVRVLSGGGFSGQQKPFATVAKQVDDDALVVIVTPTSDGETALFDLVKEVSNTVTAVRGAAPDAKVLLVGPIGATSQAASLKPMRDAVHSVAVVTGQHWVDPIAQKWVGTRVDANGLVTTDGLKAVGADLGGQAKSLLTD